MKTQFILFVFLTTLGFSEPYQKALVLTGNGHNTPYLLGIVTGSKEAGYDPDVIISSCGSSIAASIVKAVEQKNWKNFVCSQEFFNSMNKIKISDRNLFEMLGQLKNIDTMAYKLRSEGRENYPIPNIFGKTLLEAPDAKDFSLPALEIPFDSTEKYPKHVIIVGAKVLFSENEVGTPLQDKKLYKETYFTDKNLAKFLVGFQSPMERLYPNSFIDKNTEVVTNFNLIEAARHSITDPNLINANKGPDGNYYLSGVIDHYPIELAKHLSKEIIATYPNTPWGDLEENTIEGNFGYSMRSRFDYVKNLKVSGWIDHRGIIYQYASLGSARVDLVNLAKINNPVQLKPSNYADYKRICEIQWEMGKKVGAASVKKGTPESFDDIPYENLGFESASWYNPSHLENYPMYIGIAGGLWAGKIALEGFFKKKKETSEKPEKRNCFSIYSALKRAGKVTIAGGLTYGAAKGVDFLVEEKRLNKIEKALNIK